MHGLADPRIEPIDAGASLSRREFGRYEALRLVLCGALVLLGLMVAAGWAWRIDALKSVAPGLPTMKLNTALGFILSGIGLALSGSSGKYARASGAVFGLLLAGLGAATLLQYLADIDLGIDEALFRDEGTLRGSGHPGRMSPLTAIAWIALGTCALLLSIATNRREIISAHALAAVAGGISLLAAAGYTFGSEAFWSFGEYTFIAIHTATGLIIAAAAAIMTRSGEGWLRPYVDSPAALALLSRIVPVALIVPMGLGLIIMLGAGVGAYNAPFGLALFIPLTSVSMLLVSLWVAAQQRDAELVRIRHERHLQLVAAELNHRVKNTLAIVQSFAHQSFRTANSPEEARTNFEGRLTALAAAHSILTHRNWDSVNMPDLITSSLDVHNDAAGRFYLDGPDLVISPKTSVTLAMTLHELATNSLKYGALSVPEGRVRIAWAIDDSGFRFGWADENGPSAAQPERRGFGTQMLERALASELGGRASLTFAPGGFRYEVWAPGGAEL